MFDAGQSFLFDAAQLIAAVRDGSHATRIAGFTGLTATESAQLVEAGQLLVSWYERTYTQPTQPPAWRPDRLDYHFDCVSGGEAVTLTADDHRGGDLDWHAFDVGSPVASGRTAPTVTALSFLPTTVRFAGMPSPRYWEMEDGKTDFGRLDINTNDLARLLLAEYMLLFSNDWCAVPLALSVGSFTRIQGLLVTDVFGEQTLIRAADRGRDSDWQRWSMYRLDGDDSANMGLLLAPALASGMRSAPVEQVRFLRDEMANMVWAVEYRVASKLGEPFNPATRAARPAVARPGRNGGAFPSRRLGAGQLAAVHPGTPARVAAQHPPAARAATRPASIAARRRARRAGTLLRRGRGGSARRAARHARLPPRPLDRRDDISLDGTRIAHRSRRGFERPGI